MKTVLKVLLATATVMAIIFTGVWGIITLDSDTDTGWKLLGWVITLLTFSQPKMPTHFEFEMESISKVVNDNWQDYESIKTTTNSQGHIELVGKYLNL